MQDLKIVKYTIFSNDVFNLDYNLIIIFVYYKLYFTCCWVRVSVGSIGSAGSVGRAGSIGSAGSVGSAGSIGSVGRIAITCTVLLS